MCARYENCDGYRNEKPWWGEGVNCRTIISKFHRELTPAEKLLKAVSSGF